MTNHRAWCLLTSGVVALSAFAGCSSDSPEVASTTSTSAAVATTATTATSTLDPSAGGANGQYLSELKSLCTTAGEELTPIVGTMLSNPSAVTVAQVEQLIDRLRSLIIDADALARPADLDSLFEAWMVAVNDLVVVVEGVLPVLKGEVAPPPDLLSTVVEASGAVSSAAAALGTPSCGVDRWTAAM